MGKIKLFPEETNLSDFLSAEKQIFEINYPQTHFFIEETKKRYQLDQVQFRQMLHNLIHNAIKFADVKNPCINVILSSENEKLYLHIEDNGDGIKNIDISKIFDKYSSEMSSSS